MRVDVKALARDICHCRARERSWFSHLPEYESDYLMYHFVLPLLRGKPVRVPDLDMGAFTLDQVYELQDFIYSYDGPYDVTVPCGLAEMASYSAPRLKLGRAFC